MLIKVYHYHTQIDCSLLLTYFTYYGNKNHSLFAASANQSEKN